MNSSNSTNVSGSLFAGGLVASLLSAVAVYLVSSNASLSHASAYQFTHHVTFSSIIFAAVFAVLWQSCGILLGLYGNSRESRASSLAKALECSIAMTILLGLCMVLTEPKPPLVRVMTAFMGCALACELLRLGLRMLFRASPTRVVIVGCDRLAAKAWREFRVHRGRQIQVVGFIHHPATSEMMPDIASRCLGDIEALPRIVLEQHIDDVIVATPMSSLSKILEDSITSAGSLGARILCLKDICGIHPRSKPRNDEDICFELVPAPELGGISQIAKRIFDLVVSAVMLMLGGLFLIPLGILALIQSRPITYRPQVHLGFRRHPFLRSRLCSGPRDHRIHLLLDTLPGLWNVLRGEMSLVGPPPISEAQASQVDTATLAFRFNTRPGVIGPHVGHPTSAALASRPTDTPGWSLRTDLLILARIFRVVSERAAANETQAETL